MEKEIISVIVPIYKVESYLENCIKSIVAQTYKNLDIILVDDGSPDRCPLICDQYARMDNRIRVIHKENGGLSDARNAGLDIAIGEFITFIDSDDFVFPDYIEILYSLCKKYNADFSMCQCIHCGMGDTLNTVQREQGSDIIEIFEGRDKMKAYLATGKIDTVAWKKLYSIDLIKNIRFPFGKLHEDAFFTPIILDKAKRVVITKKIGYVYRINANSIMNSGFSVKRLDAIEAKIIQRELIKTKYSELLVYASAGVIYACNLCLKEMAIKKYYDNKIEKKIQKLYRKYTIDYCKIKKTSLKGKIVAIAATINTRLARSFVNIFINFSRGR